MASILPLSTTATQVLQSYAIIAAALAAGTNLSTTLLTVPVILTSPHNLLVEQWTILYNRGIFPSVGFSISSAVSFAVLAFSSYRTLSATPAIAKLYGTAALAAFGMAPWTQLVMLDTNKTLQGLEKSRVEGKGVERKAGEVPVDRLVETWGALNFVRGFFPLTAAVMGVWASLK